MIFTREKVHVIRIQTKAPVQSMRSESRSEQNRILGLSCPPRKETFLHGLGGVRGDKPLSLQGGLIVTDEFLQLLTVF